MSEVQEEYKGCLIFGIAIGDRPPYQGMCRIEKPFPPPGWGVQVETTLPGDSFDTEKEAQQASLRMARSFVDLNLTWFDSHKGIEKDQASVNREPRSADTDLSQPVTR